MDSGRGEVKKEKGRSRKTERDEWRWSGRDDRREDEEGSQEER